jgi:hypothetical protein
MSDPRLDGIDDDFDDENRCEGCGAIDGEGCCPLCCGHSYTPGSEECDFCEYYHECAVHINHVVRRKP